MWPKFAPKVGPESWPRKLADFLLEVPLKVLAKKTGIDF